MILEGHLVNLCGVIAKHVTANIEKNTKF